MEDSIAVCCADIKVQRAVRYFALKISKRFPNTMELEDAENDLWVHIIEKIPDWDGKKPIADFARAKAFSRYGNLTAYARNKGKYAIESAIRDDDTVFISNSTYTPFSDFVLELDSIESMLFRRSGESKMYFVYWKVFICLRNGYTRKAIAKMLGYSESYTRLLITRMRRVIVANYT